MIKLKIWLFFITIEATKVFAEVNEEFRFFDNNFALGAREINSKNNYTATALTLDAELLTKNNLWIEINTSSELSYSLGNNINPGVTQLNNNVSGSFFGGKAGYAVQPAYSFNIIPYFGFGYSNEMLSYNEMSIEQFIIHNPSFNWSLGVNGEFSILPKTLKVAIDTAFVYSNHKPVLPNNIDGSLSHQNYSNYGILVTPQIQWVVGNQFFITAYYQFNPTWGGYSNFDHIYYPQIGVSSNQLVQADPITNSIGIKFGFVF